MKKITLICLALFLSVILSVFISCDDVERVKDAVESFENEVASIEKTHDFEKGIETYKIKFSDGTFKKLEIKNEKDVSIKNAELDDVGNLILTMSDDTIRNLGKASGENGEKGEKGDNGDKGQKGSGGDRGNSIDKIVRNDCDLEIFYTDGTSEIIENAYEKDSWTIVYESFKRKYPDYEATEEEFVVDIVANLLFTTECTVKFEIDGYDTNIPDQKILWGEKVKEPNVSDYLDNERYSYEVEGWYVGEEKWSFIGCTVTEDITLVAKVKNNCKHPLGFENESVSGDPTCEEGSILISRCSLCQGTKETVIEEALGHKWVNDGETGDGWVITNFQKTRQCLRKGCDKVETQECMELTLFATITATSEAGGYPEFEQWPELLTDGDWGNTGACAQAGAPLVIELDFSSVQCVDADILAFSASGTGDEGNYSNYSILVTYKDQQEAMLVSSGKITSSNNTKETAIVVDFGENNKEIVKIQIVLDNPTSLDCFYEILVGRYESEE